MKFCIDDANVEKIRRIYEYYPVDGVSTNPSILAKAGRDPYEVLKEIRSIIGEIPRSEEIYAVLEKMGAKRCLQDIGIPQEALPVIIKRSPLIRNRLTLMRMRRMLRLADEATM